jgi:hypothetical protein
VGSGERKFPNRGGGRRGDCRRPLIGGLASDSAGGAIAGGLLGGLAGGLVGNAIESKREDYASTAREYNYRPDRGTLLRLEDVDADPSRVDPRENVQLVARYALLPPRGDERVTVLEQWHITHEGRTVGDPALTVTRPGGTWSSAIPLRLPAGTEPGVYRPTVEIEAGGERDRGTTTFIVG